MYFKALAMGNVAQSLVSIQPNARNTISGRNTRIDNAYILAHWPLGRLRHAAASVA